jgi:GNAT superfamily N-acetyltransferase
MTEYIIRSLKASELAQIYPRIEADFAIGEYPPMEVLYHQMVEGSQEGYVLVDEERCLAYSFCAASPNHEHILITLFAVFLEYRGQGIGTAFLKKLHGLFEREEIIIVEVEKPELAQTEIERRKRIQRIAFYEKEGYILVKGIEYIIWGIPMHLMVWSHNDSLAVIIKEVKQIMYQIYFKLLGERFINKMQFTETGNDKQ